MRLERKSFVHHQEKSIHFEWDGKNSNRTDIKKIISWKTLI